MMIKNIFKTIEIAVATIILVALAMGIFTIHSLQTGEAKLQQTVTYGDWEESQVNDTTIVMTRAKNVETNGVEFNGINVTW